MTTARVAQSAIVGDIACIRYSRGHIEIIDLIRLGKVACECYAALNTQTQRLRLPNLGSLQLGIS